MGGISGIFGGEYYWYFQRELLLVWSAVTITGKVGGLLVWSGGDTIASCTIHRLLSAPSMLLLLPSLSPHPLAILDSHALCGS